MLITIIAVIGVVGSLLTKIANFYLTGKMLNRRDLKNYKLSDYKNYYSKSGYRIFVFGHFLWITSFIVVILMVVFKLWK
ncbi:MAG: hypothetical protein WCT99_13440 [Bacteroidota bacterium]|jgi:hypothetical protein